MIPVIVLLIVGILLVSMIGSAVSTITTGGEIRYNEKQFQSYANQQYATEFGNSSAYEDNLLIVFLTDEEHDDYYCIAWCGENLHSKINNMFGDENTPFGRAVLASVPDYYEYSLSSNLVSIMDTMSEKITALNLQSSFQSQTNHNSMTASHLTNHTSTPVSSETVNLGLQRFTEATDIPTVIVVDTMENVFGKTISASDIVSILFLLVVAGVAIYFLVKGIRRNKQKNNTDYQNDNQNQSYQSGAYNGTR